MLVALWEDLEEDVSYSQGDFSKSKSGLSDQYSQQLKYMDKARGEIWVKHQSIYSSQSTSSAALTFLCHLETVPPGFMVRLVF